MRKVAGDRDRRCLGVDAAPRAYDLGADCKFRVGNVRKREMLSGGDAFLAYRLSLAGRRLHRKRDTGKLDAASVPNDLLGRVAT